MPFHVPVVDISPYVQGGTPADRAEVARAIDTACSEVGFIQILGHGIAPEVQQGLADALASSSPSTSRPRRASAPRPG